MLQIKASRKTEGDFPVDQWQRMPAMQEPQETWVWSLGQEDPLEKGMKTHSSIIVLRILWTEEPGGLHSTGHKESNTAEVI